MTYEEAINYLEAANVFGIQLGLGRIQNLLERLEIPKISIRRSTSPALTARAR